MSISSISIVDSMKEKTVSVLYLNHSIILLLLLVDEVETTFDQVESPHSVHSIFDLSFITVRKRVNCIPHQLELIIGGIIGKKIRGYKVIKRVLKLIALVKRKKVVTDYLRLHCNGKSVLLVTPIRWGSLCEGLVRFLEVKDKLFEV